MKHSKVNIRHYVPLFGIICASVLGFSLFSYDRFFQMAVVIGSSLAYISWGVVHHYLHKDLYFAVIVEYVTIAALGVAVIFLLLFRA